MKKSLSTLITLLFLGLAAGSVNVFGQTSPSYEEVTTYDDLYATVDVDGVREYTNTPRPESVATYYVDEDYEYYVDDYEYYDEGIVAESVMYAYANEPLPASSLVTKTVTGTPVQPKSAANLASIHELIEKYAEESNLDPSLIRSIIDQESGFNHRAVSRAGARGLMQLMPSTAKSLGVRNSFDPEENIRAGVRHFRSLMDKFNEDLDLSLAAYNAGENIVSRLGRIPDYKETKEYVTSVKKKYEMSDRDETPAPLLPQSAPIVRYTDESGVTHLTNIRTFN
ncbi:MAG: lytic transglycosylase domain-containing protein [Acidobacteriota bacterium]|jgi:hypothetical protein|nr:lytic transglycosylase domain-containing protein [Acidobacteriota bacterium]